MATLKENSPNIASPLLCDLSFELKSIGAMELSVLQVIESQEHWGWEEEGSDRGEPQRRERGRDGGREGEGEKEPEITLTLARLVGEPCLDLYYQA